MIIFIIICLLLYLWWKHSNYKYLKETSFERDLLEKYNLSLLGYIKTGILDEKAYKLREELVNVLVKVITKNNKKHINFFLISIKKAWYDVIRERMRILLNEKETLTPDDEVALCKLNPYYWMLNLWLTTDVSSGSNCKIDLSKTGLTKDEINMNFYLCQKGCLELIRMGV